MLPREIPLEKSGSGIAGRPASRLTLDSLMTEASASGAFSSRSASSLEITPPIMNALSSQGPLFQINSVFGDPRAQPIHTIPSVRVCLDDNLFQGPNYRKLAWLCMVGDIRAQRSFKVCGEPIDAEFMTRLRSCALAIAPQANILDILRELQSLDSFPYLVAYMQRKKMPMVDEKSESSPRTGDDYLEYINLLNQLMMMATQLHNDAMDPRNHKYSAHQIAILYQSLNMLKGQTKPLRKRIEERFDEIKTITERAVSPYLGAELQFWLQQITWDCRCMIVDLPPFIHDKLRCISDIIHL